MKNLSIEGAVENVGASQGYVGISVLYHRPETTEPPSVTTAWQLTDDEIGKLLMGAPLVLEILGMKQPPVKLYVGRIPE